MTAIQDSHLNSCNQLTVSLPTLPSSVPANLNGPLTKLIKPVAHPMSSSFIPCGPPLTFSHRKTSHRLAQQSWSVKVLKMGLQNIFNVFLFISIKMNAFLPIFKKSYHYQFFVYFQVLKTKFLYQMFSSLNLIFLIGKL